MTEQEKMQDEIDSYRSGVIDYKVLRFLTLLSFHLRGCDDVSNYPGSARLCKV